MLKNYFIIGWRNLVKNRLFSLINITGMSISIASFILISLFVYDELRFDKHIEGHENKYRVYNDEYTEGGDSRKLSMVPPVIGPTIKDEYAEVEDYARILNLQSSVLLEAGDTKITENRGGYVDPSIFDMFSIGLVEGSLATALRDSRSIALSESAALRLFGKTQVVNTIIQVDNEDFTVSAIYKDFPAHSHLQLNYMLSMKGLSDQIPERMEGWQWRQFHTYVRMKPGTQEASFEGKLALFAEGNAWPKTKPGGSWYIPRLMPLTDVHLHAADQQWDLAVRGNANTVYILSGTAIFILIIAIFNFVNLSTARAASRIKEVGVRKVIGAVRSQLIYQFISESIILSFLALFLGVVLVELALPYLNNFTEKAIPGTLVFYHPAIIGIGFIFSAIVGMAAGAYPAFYISGFRPAQVLSNRLSPRSGKAMLRKGLVVVQFVLSFFLIIASLVVSDQHGYMRNKDMGFNKDNLIVIPLRPEMLANYETTKNRFLNHPNIIDATMGYGLPGQAFAGDGILDVENDRRHSISLLTVDHDYVRTLGAEIIAGRDFSKERLSDELDAFIISVKTAEMLGYKEPADAIGHELAWERWDNPDSVKSGKVIGVVKDFHLNSLKEAITPIAIHVYPFAYSTITLRVKPYDIPGTLEHIESTYAGFNSEWPLEYKFLDENFDRLYKTEQKLAVMFTLFTGLSIFVACFGLFGLVVFSTAQRYKEISIRKVLGAKELSIVLALIRNYLLLIAVAFAVAVPLSYYFAHEWLQNFSFRIDITPVLFVKSGLFILGLALITTGLQAFRAARANPVDALKEQ